MNQEQSLVASATSQGLTLFEFVIWLGVSVAFTPLLTGTIAYYLYRWRDRSPRKWKQINLVLLLGLLIDGVLFLLF